MPTIDEAVRQNLDRRSKLGNAPFDPMVPTPPPTAPRTIESPPPLVMRAGLPSRGSFPTSMVLDTDLDNDVDGIRFRSRLFRPGALERSVKVSPASATANAQVVKVPDGTPLQVTSLTATEIPTKLNGQLVALVTLTWLPGVTDTFYSYAQAWVTGYHGLTGAQLVASGPSPLTFSLDATNETVTFTVVAVSASGLKASTPDAPKAVVVLSPTSGTLPAPTVTQSLVALSGGGYQFTFSFLSGLLTNIVQAYNVYRNTTNSFSSSTLVRTVPQPQTNVGSYVFQDFSAVSTASTQYFYFVTAVDINGSESSNTAAQSGTVVTGTSVGINGQGNIPATGFVAAPLTFLTFEASSGLRGTVKMQWSSFTLFRADGSSVSIPGSSSLSVPASPTLSQVAGGTLAGRTYFVRVGLVKDETILGISGESSLAVSANNVLKITSPASVAGYDGWVPLVSGTGNPVANGAADQERVITESLPSSPIAFGTDFTEAITGLTENANSGTFDFDNTSGAGQGVRNWFRGDGGAGLLATTGYAIAPYISAFTQILTWVKGGPRTPNTAEVATLQSGDGKIAASNGSVSVTMPAAGGSGSSSGGGPGGGRAQL